MFADDRKLYWRARSNLAYDLSARDRKHGPRLARFYDDHLAGHLVLDTLDTARSYFAGSEPREGDSSAEWRPPLHG